MMQIKLVEHLMNNSLITGYPVDAPQDIPTEVGPRTSIYVRILAMVPGISKNFYEYSYEGLTEEVMNDANEPSGPESFFRPIPRPILKSHRLPDVDECIGRLHYSQWDKDIKGIIADGIISGIENVEKVLDERYLTTSVGIVTDFANCSICKEEPIMGDSGPECPNGHIWGQKYNNLLCTLKAGHIWGREISTVNSPSITSSRIIYAEDEKKKSNNIIESEKKPIIINEGECDSIEELKGLHRMYHTSFKENGPSQYVIFSHRSIVYKLAGKLGFQHPLIAEVVDELDETI